MKSKYGLIQLLWIWDHDNCHWNEKKLTESICQSQNHVSCVYIPVQLNVFTDHSPLDLHSVSFGPAILKPEVQVTFRLLPKVFFPPENCPFLTENPSALHVTSSQHSKQTHFINIPLFLTALCLMFYFSLGSLIDVTAEEGFGEISLTKDVCKIYEREGNGNTWFRKSKSYEMLFLD